VRLGFDLDGVLADFAGAYLELERRLFGAAEASADVDVPRPEEIVDDEEVPEGRERQRESPATDARRAREEYRSARRKREAIWHAIRATENFWTTLPPIDPDAVLRIHMQALARRWEVFFITQRPATAGETVQRQTQRWLAARGFDLPSVIVLPGSRGSVAGALHLDYLVDDLPKNCVDVLAESTTRPILILPDPDDAPGASARRLGIAVVPSIAAALDLLEQDPLEPAAASLLQRLRRSIFS
jgi:hypothetical protein